MGTSKNRSYSSDATKLSANDSASFPFRFMDVHARAARDPHREQFFEVPSYLSAAIVVAVCEDGSPLASFEAKPRSDAILAPPAGVVSLSSLERKIAADELASYCLFR